MVDRAGAVSLARHHPLTVEGEDIGSFDLLVGCGDGGASYDVSYIERRRGTGNFALPAELGGVKLRVGDLVAGLTVASSERRREPDELVTYASGTVPVAQIGAFASNGSHSMVIETKTGGTKDSGAITVIRFGNTGAQLNLPRLAASCSKSGAVRADLAPIKKTGGLAAAQ
jgi:hypothetical protein